MLACLLQTGCARKSSAPQGRILPPAYKISVAPFTQPVDPSQLINGTLPEKQGLIPPNELEGLNLELRRVLLTSTNRQYEFIPVQNLPKDWHSAKSSAQPSALGRWLEYGRKHNASWLLVPQVFDWHEREGSEAGVTSSAHIRLEFFLLDISKGLPLKRSVFEEKQVGLVDDLLSVGTFVKRGGKWVTSRELGIDGMIKAVQDLGL